MATATNPKQLKDVILGRLGSPVITVEVTEHQVYEAIDQALDLYIDYHFDGINKQYLIHTLTEDEVSSGLIDTGVHLRTVTRVFKQSYGMSSGWGEGSIYDVGWHAAADLIKTMSGSLSGCSCSNGMFGGGGYGLATWDAFYQQLELMQRFFSPEFQFWHNSDSNKLKILNEGDLRVGQVIIVEAYVAAGVYVDQSYLPATDSNGQYITRAEGTYHDPYNYTVQSTSGTGPGAQFYNQPVYNNRWLKDMATAFAKRQWGSNLKKFNGQPLPGGIQVNGQAIYDEAVEEIKELRDELLTLTEPMPIFFE